MLLVIITLVKPPHNVFIFKPLYVVDTERNHYKTQISDYNLANRILEVGLSLRVACLLSSYYFSF